MRAQLKFVLLVVGLLVAAVVALRPHASERVAVLADTGRHVEAIALLDRQLAERPDDPAPLVALGRSYAALNNYQKAAEALKQYTAARPTDGEAHGRLADYLKALHDLSGRVEALERNIEFNPTPTRGLELADLYRFQGRDADERSLLARFIPQLTPKNGLLLRLAELLVKGGDRDAAIALLDRSVAGPHSPGGADGGHERILLARLLAESGRITEALSLGRNWIAEWKDAYFSLRLTMTLAALAPGEHTNELAQSVVAKHPDVLMFAARELFSHGAQPAARHVLVHWASSARVPAAEEFGAFLTVCREIGEPQIIWEAFSTVLSQRRSDQLVIRFSEAVAAEYGIGAIAPFWAHLPTSAMQQQSLLPAKLAFHQRDLPLTQHLLNAVDIEMLGQGDRLMWIELLRASSTPRDAFNSLQARRHRGNFPAELLLEFARHAGMLGLDGIYRAALIELSQRAARP